MSEQKQQEQGKYRPITLRFTTDLHWNGWKDVSEVDDYMLQKSCVCEITGFVVSEDAEKYAIASSILHGERIDGFRLVHKNSIQYNSEDQNNQGQPQSMNQDVQSPNHNTGGFFKPE